MNLDNVQPHNDFVILSKKTIPRKGLIIESGAEEYHFIVQKQGEESPYKGWIAVVSLYDCVPFKHGDLSLYLAPKDKIMCYIRSHCDADCVDKS